MKNEIVAVICETAKGYSETGMNISANSMLTEVVSSLELVELFLELEKQYEITFGAESYFGLTVSDLADVIVGLIENKKVQSMEMENVLSELFE